AGAYPLPFGTLEIDTDPTRYAWGGHQLTDFYPVAEITVEGFPTYYRWQGIGAPLAAKVIPNDRDILAPRMRVPVTVVLRPDALARDLRSGAVRANLEVYPGYGDQRIMVGKVEVPLEAEPTATWAWGLADTKIWEREFTGLLHGSGVITDKTRL